MKIYTSYFAKLDVLNSVDIVPVSISLSSPVWFMGIEYKDLAPENWILRYKNEPEIYTHYFKERILGKLSPERVLLDLAEIGRGKDVAILCYEKPGSFCHRHLVREWLNNFIGTCEPKEPALLRDIHKYLLLKEVTLMPITEFQKELPLVALFGN